MPGMPKNVKKGPERLKVPKKTRKCPALQNLKKFYLKLFLGLPLDVHENDQRRLNTKMIHFSRDMLLSDLTSEPRDVFELYRATTDPRIDAKGVMPIPRCLVLCQHMHGYSSQCEHKMIVMMLIPVAMRIACSASKTEDDGAE